MLRKINLLKFSTREPERLFRIHPADCVLVVAFVQKKNINPELPECAPLFDLLSREKPCQRVTPPSVHSFTRGAELGSKLLANAQIWRKRNEPGKELNVEHGFDLLRLGVDRGNALEGPVALPAILPRLPNDVGIEKAQASTSERLFPNLYKRAQGFIPPKVFPCGLLFINPALLFVLSFLIKRILTWS